MFFFISLIFYCNWLLFRSCMHVRATCFEFVSVYTIFRLGFGNASTMWYCFIVFFFIYPYWIPLHFVPVPCQICSSNNCCLFCFLFFFVFFFVVFLFVQWVKVRGDCFFCWYWWICWPSLFNLSFHNTTLFYTSSISFELLISN